MTPWIDDHPLTLDERIDRVGREALKDPGKVLAVALESAAVQEQIYFVDQVTTLYPRVHLLEHVDSTQPGITLLRFAADP